MSSSTIARTATTPAAKGTCFMVTLETDGLSPGSHIRSISACVMDKDRIHDAVHQFDQLVGGSQTDKPRARTAKRVPITLAINRFHQWVVGYPSPHFFWCCGSHVYYAIYAETCQSLGIQTPFQYYNVRDTRTAMEVRGIDHAKAKALIPDEVKKVLVIGCPVSDCIKQTYRSGVFEDNSAVMFKSVSCTTANIRSTVCMICRWVLFVPLVLMVANIVLRIILNEATNAFEFILPVVIVLFIELFGLLE